MNAHHHQQELDHHALSLGIVSCNISFKDDATLEQKKAALTELAKRADRHFRGALETGLIN